MRRSLSNRKIIVAAGSCSILFNFHKCYEVCIVIFQDKEIEVKKD